MEDMQMDASSHEQDVSRNRNKSFEERQKDIFDQLNVIKHSLNNSTNRSNVQIERSDMNTSDDYKGKQRSTKHFRGRESIFKRPEAPISKCLPVRRAPDFQVNPHKWKKYTLDDVSSEDMSEKSNQAAAFSFLKELESRKEKQFNDDSSSADSKIVFKKSVLVKNAISNDSEEKASFKSSKLVMPEYVIGQKKHKEAKKSSACKTKVKSSNEMKLDHLFDEEDEDNGD